MNLVHPRPGTGRGGAGQGTSRRRAARFTILKLKLDGDEAHCLALARAVREVTDARLVADANCAWTEDQARRLFPPWPTWDWSGFEQPLPEDDLEGLRRLHAEAPVPIFADEPVRTARDIPRLADCMDGVNIKLMKAGGLREALRMIAVARAHDLQVMIGCMVETSVGITAAAHLAPLVDWADLDATRACQRSFAGVGVRAVAGLSCHRPGPGGRTGQSTIEAGEVMEETLSPSFLLSSCRPFTSGGRPLGRRLAAVPKGFRARESTRNGFFLLGGAVRWHSLLFGGRWAYPGSPGRTGPLLGTIVVVALGFEWLRDLYSQPGMFCLGTFGSSFPVGLAWRRLP